MSETATSRFACEACNRSYTWKQELAGKRVKCKCGHVMTVAESMAQEPKDDLYDLAPDPELTKAKSAPRVPLAPRTTSSAAPVHATAAVAAAPASPTLGYQRGPTAREKELTSNATLVDMKRDIYMPSILLAIGFALYIGFYAYRYDLGGGEIAATGIGLAILTSFKAALLVGFALVAAGPLGVSFGGLWTACLKLAAIAVFCDGVTSWADHGMASISGGFGSGFISLPIALGIYWVLLIQLFSMDSGDSWMVVMVLTAFDWIVKMVLMMILMAMILSWGGVSGAAIPTIGGGGSGGSSSMSAEIAEMKDAGMLEEARAFMKKGKQAVLSGPTEKWYAAGCPNVWFEVSRDLNGRTEAGGLIVELPKDKAKRAECYTILKDYYKALNISVDPEDLEDDGERYMHVEVMDASRGGF